MHVRDVRKQDFKGIDRVKPNLMPFDNNEEEAIAKIDIHAHEDLSDYKTKPLRPTEHRRTSNSRMGPLAPGVQEDDDGADASIMPSPKTTSPRPLCSVAFVA